MALPLIFLILYAFIPAGSAATDQCDTYQTVVCVTDIFDGLRNNGVDHLCKGANGLLNASWCLQDMQTDCSEYMSKAIFNQLNNPVKFVPGINKACTKVNKLKSQEACMYKGVLQLDKCLATSANRELSGELRNIDYRRPTSGYTLLLASCSYFEALYACVSSSFRQCGSTASNLLVEMIKPIGPECIFLNKGLKMAPSIFILVSSMVLKIFFQFIHLGS